MRRGKSKLKPAGIGLREENSQVLSRLRQSSNPSQSDILLKGLDLLSEYYLLGLDKPPLNLELRELETEAMRHAEALRQVRKKEEAIGLMAQELANIEEILNKYQGNKSALIQILLDIQAKNHWISEPALMWVAERLGVPWSQIYHITTFYKAFSLIPRGRHMAQVCLGTACQVRGGARLLEKMIDILKIKPGKTDQEQKFTLTTVNCLGCCALGPVMVVDGKYYSNPTVREIRRVIAACE